MALHRADGGGFFKEVPWRSVEVPAIVAGFGELFFRAESHDPQALPNLNKFMQNTLEDGGFDEVQADNPTINGGIRRSTKTNIRTYHMKTCIYTISSLALAASISFAQEGPKGPKGPGGPKGPRPNLEEIFKKLDADSSGSVSLDEFKAAPRAQKNPERAEGVFKKIDEDSDGALTLEEFKSHRPPHGRPPGEEKGPGKGRGRGDGDREGPPPAPPEE